VDPHVALVTGGASGIGLATARLLKVRGHTIIIADRDATSLEKAKDEGFEPVVMDVGVSADWQRLADLVRERHGRLDILVNNAGVAHIAPLVETTDEQLRSVLNTNVLSVLYGTRALWDLLVASGGCVVNVASVAALVGQDRAAVYVASKGAVVALTRALAVELAPYGVRVNSVCPGPTLTPLLERHFQQLPDEDEARRRLTQRLPIGRLLTAEDVAPTIVHLASAGTEAVTGANFVVDGGLTATFDFGSSFAGGGTDGIRL
jgi:NAD(P)-dependent dehydrogenase (short-subunit alcohol dehydrogenase family)